MQAQTENPITAPASSSSPPTPTGQLVRRSPAEVLRFLAQRAAQTQEVRARYEAGDRRMRIGSAIIGEQDAADIARTEKSRERLAATRQADLEAKSRQLMAANGLPKRYRPARFSEIHPEIAAMRGSAGSYGEAAEAMVGLLKSPGMIFLLGSRGPGKTWLASALVNEFCRCRRPAKYLDAMDYFLEIKATYNPNSLLDQAKVEAKYLRHELLVLDEVHERGDTQWEDRMLTRLCNKRYNSLHSTILIANLTPEAFIERIGSSVEDRRYDGGRVVICDWPTLRGHPLAALFNQRSQEEQ